MSQQPWTVVVFDRREIVREGLRALLDGIEGITVVGEAGSAEEAITMSVTLRPTLVIADVDVAADEGLKTIERVKSEAPDIVVLAFTDEDGEIVLDAIRAGASGYLKKSATSADLRAMLGSLASDRIYLSSGLAARPPRSEENAAAKATRAGSTTKREREVLDLLAQGMSARKIGSTLGISERTVNTHIANLYRRLRVSNRVDAVMEAVRSGLVRLPE